MVMHEPAASGHVFVDLITAGYFVTRGVEMDVEILICDFFEDLSQIVVTIPHHTGEASDIQDVQFTILG
jgi:hypothetical protein